MVNLTLTQVFLVWVVGFGFLTYLIKNKVVSFFNSAGIPRFLSYLIIILPLVLVEEFLTCETPFLSCIQITVPVFYIMFLMIYLVEKIFKLKHIALAIIFAIMGWINEFILVGRINQLDLVVLILFSVLNSLIYGVIALVPSYYLEKSRR